MSQPGLLEWNPGREPTSSKPSPPEPYKSPKLTGARTLDALCLVGCSLTRTCGRHHEWTTARHHVGTWCHERISMRSQIFLNLPSPRPRSCITASSPSTNILNTSSTGASTEAFPTCVLFSSPGTQPQAKPAKPGPKEIHSWLMSCSSRQRWRMPQRCLDAGCKCHTCYLHVSHRVADSFSGVSAVLHFPYSTKCMYLSYVSQGCHDEQFRPQPSPMRKKAAPCSCASEP